MYDWTIGMLGRAGQGIVPPGLAFCPARYDLRWAEHVSFLRRPGLRSGQLDVL